MLYLIGTKQTKPNRIEISELEKNRQYHVDYARWVVGEGCTSGHREHMDRYKRNMNFYKNKQWVMKEDLEAFFKDESGQDRNRIKVTQNYIQPMVEQYRGNAERMSFDIKAVSISPMAKSRRDQQLSRLLMYQTTATALPQFGDYMKNQGYPIEQTEDATINRFENTYTDKYIISINRLLRYSKNVNQLDKHRRPLAMDMALAGIGILQPYPYNGEWLFKRIVPDQFGFDRGAQESDLSDSEFFFEFDFALATNVYEQYQDINYLERQAIEKYVSNIGAVQATGRPYDVSHRVPIYTATWRDTLSDTYGYVTDEFGQRVLERINYIPEYAEKAKYTRTDVISVDNLTPYQKKVLQGRSTRNLQVDLWRYCKFVPYEAVAGRGLTGDNPVRDIVLAFGHIPYQEPDLYHPTNMLPPYKCGTWLYSEGELLAPVDIAISPQRIMNRFLSVMENQINNSGGSGPLYDKDLLGDENEDVVQAKMKRGEPVGIHGKGRGVSNAVSKYDAGIKESTLVFANLVENFRMGMEQTTGVNQGLKGQTDNPDQLVGVMQLMIQRGSILQEPFYAAISDIYKACYQSVATSGKRYYIDMDAELVDAVGIDSAEVLKLSRDMRMENFRVSLERTVDAKTERMYVDQRTLLWLQYGLIDHVTAAVLIGRASDEEALAEMREYQKRLADTRRKAEAAADDGAMLEANQKEQMGQVIYGEQLRQEAREDDQKDKDRSTKIVTAALKKQPQTQQ